MICKTCGGEIADNSAFCIHCGASVETPEPQAQNTQPMFTQYAEPQQNQLQHTEQPQYQQPYANYNGAQDFYYAAKQYIEIAGSVLAPSIVGLALSWAIPLIGQIIGLIMSGNVNSKIRSLPFIDEAMLDPQTLNEYNSARRKVKTASILSKISKIYSIVALIFWICYAVFWVFYFFFVFFVIGMASY